MIAATALLLTPLSASASTGLTSSSTTTVSFNADCLDAIENAPAAELDRGDCKETTTTTVSTVFETVDAAEATSVSGLTSAETASLVAAAKAGSVKKKWYTQHKTGAVYTRTHHGYFYYDGQRAWVGQKYRGAVGSHTCFNNYVAYPWEVKKISCKEAGGASYRTMTDRWTVVWPGKVQYEVNEHVDYRAQQRHDHLTRSSLLATDPCLQDEDPGRATPCDRMIGNDPLPVPDNCPRPV
jgi:hypothetical protein